MAAREREFSQTPSKVQLDSARYVIPRYTNLLLDLGHRAVTLLQYAHFYGPAMPVRDIATKFEVDSGAVIFDTHALEKANILKRTADGYKIKDSKFYETYAVKWDNDFESWLTANPTKVDGKIIDTFMNEMRIRRMSPLYKAPGGRPTSF